MLLAIFLVGLFPRGVTRAISTLTTKPGEVLGYGALALVGLPVAVVVLVVVAITIPIAVFLGAAWPVGMWTGAVIVGIALGEMIAEQLRKAYWSRLLTAPAGVLALWAVGQIPYIGPLVLIGSVVAGMGALKVVILKKDALAEDALAEDAPAETVDDEREE